MASLPSPMHGPLAVVDNDGDGATGDEVNDNGDGATGDDDDYEGNGATGYNADDNDNDATDDNISDNGDGIRGDDLDDDSHGGMGNDVNHYGDGTAYDDIDDDCDSATGGEVNDNGDGAKLSSPLMRRHLCRRRNGVVALVVMASLPSPMNRCLAIVDNDGNGVTGNDDNDFDDATDFAIVAMALLPSSQWRCYRHRCASIVPLLTMMATA